MARSYSRRPPDEQSDAQDLPITPDYFQTLQIPLKAGRTFTDQDNLQNTKVVIVNEKMARQLWPGESPIGRRFTIWRDEKFRVKLSAWSAIRRERSIKNPGTR